MIAKGELLELDKIAIRVEMQHIGLTMVNTGDTLYTSIREDPVNFINQSFYQLRGNAYCL